MDLLLTKWSYTKVIYSVGTRPVLGRYSVGFMDAFNQEELPLTKAMSLPVLARYSGGSWR